MDSVFEIPRQFAASSHVHPQSEITDLVTALAAKSPLASPIFTGLLSAASADVAGDLTGKVKILAAVAVDGDRYVTVVDMKIGAYTLANTTPGDSLARNLIVTHSTQGGTTDTLGTLAVVGTDADGVAQDETITPVADSAVYSTKRYAGLVSITGAGWAIDAGGTPSADHITVGFDLEIEPSALQMRGGLILCPAANTVIPPAVVVGSNLTIYATTAAALIMDPNSNDRIVLDGAAGGNGKKITSASAAGDMVTIFGDSADGYTTIGRSGTWTMES